MSRCRYNSGATGKPRRLREALADCARSLRRSGQPGHGMRALAARRLNMTSIPALGTNRMTLFGRERQQARLVAVLDNQAGRRGLVQNLNIMLGRAAGLISPGEPGFDAKTSRLHRLTVRIVAVCRSCTPGRPVVFRSD